MKLIQFLDKYVTGDFVVWCPDYDEENLYTMRDLNEAYILADGDGLCLFNYMIVDGLTINNSILQVNCHFMGKKWNRDIKKFEEDYSKMKQMSLDDFI